MPTIPRMLAGVRPFRGVAHVLLALGTLSWGADAIVLPVDQDLVRRHGNYGYTPEQIQTVFSAPLTIPLDRTGLDRSLLAPPPPAGVHPRVLFNPEDLPGIRARLTGTKAGAAVMTAIRKHLDQQFGDRGDLRATYDALAAGDTRVTDADRLKRTGFTTLYECFRCLIDGDQAGMTKAAAVVVSLATLASQGIDRQIALVKGYDLPNDFRAVAQGPTYEGTLGLMYDFAYGSMTAAQRDQVRAVLVKATAGMTYVGCESLFSPNSNTSNWTPWATRMLFLTAATEGEPGHDPAAQQRAIRAQTAFLGSFYHTGEGYEGWGKQFLFLEHLAIMAKRSHDLIAATTLRTILHRYFMAALNPWGGGFTFCDSLAGSDLPYSRTCDLMMYHRFFPHDPVAEFLYRNQIKGDYANLPMEGRVNTSHPFSVTEALCSAIYACDFADGTTWEDAQRTAAADQPLSLFCEDTGNLITRAAWTADSLYLHYLNRSVMGGHRYSDRSHFSISGEGRLWGIYHKMRQVREHYLPANRSLVMIDQDGPGIAPAKCVLYQDHPLATAIATDLRAPWEYANEYLFPNPAKNGIRFPLALNAFRLHPSPLPVMDLPMDELPNWFNSTKPKAELYPGNPMDGYPWTRLPPIAYAYRTAILVRGAHPYVLIVDDVKRDETPRAYTWNLVVPDDVVLGSARRTGDDGHPGADLILDEQKPVTPARHCLVRMLEAPQLDAQAPGAITLVSQPNPPNPKPLTFPKLVITSNATEAHFKTLLVPHRDGQGLPTSTWSPDRRSVTIAWEGQVDEVTFATHTDHRCRVTIRREGRDILPIARPDQTNAAP